MQKLTFCPPPLSEWATEVREDDEPSFVIENIIPHDSLVLLSGEPKDAKKTWLAMKLALIAATGHSEGPLEVKGSVPVLYIYREGARKPTLARFDALLAHRPHTPETLSNFYFHHRGGFFLDDANAIGEVVKFVIAKEIKLVVVDTFAKSCRADENSAKDMGIAVQQAEKIRDAGATVLLVHHLRKGGHTLSNGKHGSPEPDKDLRGSSALAGAYEMHLAVRSFSVPGVKEKQAMLLVGGKEAEWAAYSYDWNFIVKDEQLHKAVLQLEKLNQMPFIEAPKTRGRFDEGEDLYV